MSHNTYVVIETKNVTQSMIDESLNSSEPHDTFRKSIDLTKSILKFHDHHPNTMGGYTKYNHHDILDFIADNSDEWETKE